MLRELQAARSRNSKEDIMDEKLSFYETDRKYYYGGELGAVYSKEKTEFAVWSPYAKSIELRLFKNGTDGAPYETLCMELCEKGVWRAAVSGDLDGIYYTYAVKHGDAVRETPDIYSKSAGLNSRRSMVVSPRSAYIEGWEHDSYVKLQSPCDALIYELHVRDFSMDENADFTYRGKFAAFCEENVKNSYGDTVGLSYIAELGVTHVHFLPVMDFASVDEAVPTFNWGYDPVLYNAPDGSYSIDPHNGYSRIKELRRLVKAMHDKGLGVILDVVYNHTFDATQSPFGIIYPHYYYRHERDGSFSNGSGCGNELASERRMMSKFICDSLCALCRDYHIDGFRFDLMGLIDTKTLNKCAKKLRMINPDIILYGEGWTGGASPLSEQRRAMKTNAADTENVAMFSDDFRDGVKGSVFCDLDCGYINGAADKNKRELIKSVMCGGIYHRDVARAYRHCWAKFPAASVNYVEAHDNLTFWDKLTLSMPKADINERLRVSRLGISLVLLAQGIPFIQAGQELLRTKPDGKGGFDSNSYRSPDSVNCIKWNCVTEHKEYLQYCKGLIAIRKAHDELRLRTAAEVREIRFTDLSGTAFAIHTGRLIIIINPHRRRAAMKLAKGEAYDVLCDGKNASVTPLYEIQGNASTAPQSVLVLRKKSDTNL